MLSLKSATALNSIDAIYDNKQTKSQLQPFKIGICYFFKPIQ